MSTFRITAATVRDYKRIREVTITPNADSSVVLIAGKNGSGKSSILEALSVALGGKKHQLTEPVRHGAEQAEIFVELDSDAGAIRIERVIQPSGESAVKVRGRDGVIAAPQKLLDGIIGARFLDPIAFISLSPRDQRDQLLQVIDADKQIRTLDDKRTSHYDRRTELGRDLKKAEGERDRLPPLEPVPEEANVAALADEQRAFAAQHAEHAKLTNALREANDETLYAIRKRDECAKECHRIDDEIEALQQRREMIASQGRLQHEDVAACEKVASEKTAALALYTDVMARQSARIAEVDAALANANATNRKATEIAFANRRRTEAEQTVERMTKAYAEESAWIEKIDRRKATILEKAKLPVDGLSYDANGITLNGHPFTQASGAEKLRVALGIAIAASPNLDDIWIRDGALMDADSLALAVEHAESNGKRLWIEVIQPQDGAIVISEGKAAE